MRLLLNFAFQTAAGWAAWTRQGKRFGKTEDRRARRSAPDDEAVHANVDLRRGSTLYLVGQ